MAGAHTTEFPLVATAVAVMLTAAFASGLRHVAPGADYATGSNPAAARLAG